MHSRLTAHRLLPALVVGALAWWLSCAHSVAQQAAPPVPAVEPPATVPVVELTAEEKSLAAIRSLLTSLGSAETELTQLRRSLSKAVTQAERDQIAAEIEAKGTQRDQLRHDIESVATGIDLDQFSGTGSTPNDLATEFEDFIRPIIGELKSLTSKPREIEALRGNVAKYQRQIEQAKSAIDHLNDLLAAAAEPVVTTQLRDLHKEWTDKLTTAENDLGVAEFKLEEAEKNRSSVFASAREAVAGFFRTRGRNFLTAGLAFVAVWFSLRLLYRKLLTYSPFHRRRERSFYVRLVDVAYQVFALAAGIFAVLVVLYSASDWVLLGLTLLFLAGLVWASKQALPLFFEQAKMMLNLGSVREGERLLFNGVPWEVKRINVYTDLDNPALTGGKLRLPIRDLVPLH
ncbi:MAG: hypothetical protein KDM63_16015, partial [Verrucomicrobiae bacterium]|nr:hypothetical protein [Verrucomicrobiae bacterium]